MIDIVKVIALLSAGNMLFDGGDGYLSSLSNQAYLLFQPVY